jgi:hypothetical protein
MPSKSRSRFAPADTGDREQSRFPDIARIFVTTSVSRILLRRLRPDIYNCRLVRIRRGNTRLMRANERISIDGNRPLPAMPRTWAQETRLLHFCQTKAISGV